MRIRNIEELTRIEQIAVNDFFTATRQNGEVCEPYIARVIQVHKDNDSITFVDHGERKEKIIHSWQNLVLYRAVGNGTFDMLAGSSSYEEMEQLSRFLTPKQKKTQPHGGQDNRFAQKVTCGTKYTEPYEVGHPV